MVLLRQAKPIDASVGNRVQDAAIEERHLSGTGVCQIILHRLLQHERGITLRIQPRNGISAAAHLLLNNLTRGLGNTGEASPLQLMQDGCLAGTRTARNHIQTVAALSMVWMKHCFLKAPKARMPEWRVTCWCGRPAFLR